MRGIIIKPTQCCGDTKRVGLVVDVIERTPIGQSIHCPYCNTITKSQGEFVRISEKSHIYKFISVQESRIKFFDKDLDKELEKESNEDLVKEKELT